MNDKHKLINLTSTSTLIEESSVIQQSISDATSSTSLVNEEETDWIEKFLIKQNELKEKFELTSSATNGLFIEWLEFFHKYFGSSDRHELKKLAKSDHRQKKLMFQKIGSNT